MSKIHDLEILSRPREKAMMNGVDSLSDGELLAIIIRCGVRGVSAIEISNNILNTYGGLVNLLNSDVYSLMKIKGIKKAKALEIAAVIELMKRVSKQNKSHLLPINTAYEAYKLIKNEMENANQELFMVLFLNIKLNLIKKEILFVGGETQSIIDVNLLFKKSILYGAKKIICIHNHPSGDPSPSNQDIKITSKIREVSKIANIELIDHIIVGKNSYFSFIEHLL